MRRLSRSKAPMSTVPSPRAHRSVEIANLRLHLRKRPRFRGLFLWRGRDSNPRPSGYELEPLDRLDYVELGFKRNSPDRTTWRSAGICRACCPICCPSRPTARPRSPRHNGGHEEGRCLRPPTSPSRPSEDYADLAATRPSPWGQHRRASEAGTAKRPQRIAASIRKKLPQRKHRRGRSPHPFEPVPSPAPACGPQVPRPIRTRSPAA
jgi:hypothetical protein